MYFITISEMLGTRGEQIARDVARSLNYSYYGEEEVLKASEEMGFFKDVQKLDEKSPPFFEKLFSVKPKVYLDRLQSVILELAKKGNSVFFGKGSQFLLHSFGCALHVFVAGSTERRIQEMMQEKGVGREVAEKWIHQSDHDRRGFLRFAFDEDWLNPNLYDLILNTDKLSIDSAVKMIIDAAKSDEIKTCGTDSIRLLGKLSLYRRVESTLWERDVMNQHLFFTAEDEDSVRLYGFVYSPDERESIGKIVKGIKGVKRVINDLAIFPGSMGAA
jgi:cytidylate kinase